MDRELRRGLLHMIDYPNIETKRLLLRELNLLDSESIFRHFSDPDVTRFMDIEPCKDIKEAEEIIQFHVDDTGCRYGLFNKESGDLVGTCGFHCWSQEPESIAEIGFDLSRLFWSQGLMQEALVEVLNMGFNMMKLYTIEATVEQDNVRSQRLLERMNFSREKELRDNLYYYTLKKADIIKG